MTSININEIFESKLQKLETIKNTTQILKCKNNVNNELQSICSDVRNRELDVIDIKNKAKSAEQKILCILNKVPLLQELNDHYSRVCNNSQIMECINAVNSAIKSKEIHHLNSKHNKSESNLYYQENMESGKTANGTDNKMSNTIHIIDLLTQNEFNNIPKYIIGRHTCTILNNFVNIINEILQEKYSFLALGRMKAKKKNKLEKYLNYKSQQTAVKVVKGGNVQFFTEEDYQIYTKSKLDKIKLNFLTALRHIKRIEFIKINKDMYYAVNV